MVLTSGQLLNVIIIPTAVFLLILLVLATFICLRITHKRERQELSQQTHEHKMRKKILEETARGVARSKQELYNDKEKRSFRERTLKKSVDLNYNVVSSRSHLVTSSMNVGFEPKSEMSMNGIGNNGYVSEETSTPSDVKFEHQREKSSQFNYRSSQELNSFHNNQQEHKVEVYETRCVDDSSSSSSSTIINVKNESAELQYSNDDFNKIADSRLSPINQSHRSNTKEKLPLNHDELMQRSQKFLSDDLDKAERYNHLPPLDNPPSVES